MFTYDPTAFRQYFEHEFTYLAGFRRNVHRYAEQPALHDPATGQNYTYRELGERVDRLAAGLAAAGVQPGDVVTYQLYNGVEFAELYLATQACGAVGSPINFRLAPGEVAYILDDSLPRVFVYDTELAESVRAALELATHRPEVLVAVGTSAATLGRRFEELFSDGAPPSATRDVYQETTRLYTSGTTGMPKGVPLNSMVELFTAHDVIMHFPLTPEDRTLNMTPWFHRGGLYSGGPNPCFYLGAPLEREAARRYQEVLTPRIFNGYGTTEAFWNTFLRPNDLTAHAGSAGRACTDDDVRVVRLFDDRPARPEELTAKDATEVGEVIVRSPKCGFSYAGSPQQESARFHHGWLYIGDLATWDAGEFVTIVGRKDDMLISGGENIHPVQIEEALNEHPGISDCVVVGVPDEQWGQLVAAYVVRSDSALRAEDCDAHCRDHPMLGAYKRPRAYRFVEELPVTATGKKIHYRATEQAINDYAAGAFTAVRNAS